MSKGQYVCDGCANMGTPICRVCTCIESRGEVVRRPQYYTRLDANAPVLQDQVELDREIRGRLDAGLPIRLASVMRRNYLIGEREEV